MLGIVFSRVLEMDHFLEFVQDEGRIGNDSFVK